MIEKLKESFRTMLHWFKNIGDSCEEEKIDKTEGIKKDEDKH